MRRVQDLRKESGFNVQDRIRVEFSASPRLGEAIEPPDLQRYEQLLVTAR